MSGTLDVGAFLNQSFPLSYIGITHGVINSPDGFDNIPLVNGQYTLAANALSTLVIDTNGGNTSNEPEDGVGTTNYVVTSFDPHPANSTPQPDDPPALNSLFLTGYTDGTVNPGDGLDKEQDYSVIGYSTDNTGAVDALLLEQWSTAVGFFGPGAPGRFTLPTQTGDANLRSFYVLSTVDNFYQESQSNTEPAFVFTQVTAVTCFAAGTRIATATGAAAVETLAVGDRVSTASGLTRPIVWIGQRTIGCLRHPDPELVWPVRIEAGAFGPGVPARDLFLSPDHAVHVDGVLIPVRLLINGGTIAQVRRPAVTYYHIELDQHDVVLAEGLPAESYLDTGNRAMLDGGDGAPLALHPDFSTTDGRMARERDSCAPFATDAAQVRPVWERLAARSCARGHAVPVLDASRAPDLRVSVDGREIYPFSVEGERYGFALPASWSELRALSRAAAPSATAPWLDDRRRLGVMVREIALEAADRGRELALDDALLRDGWWPAEPIPGGFARWTNGDAVLPLSPTGTPARLYLRCFAGSYPASEPTCDASKVMGRIA